MNRNNMSNVQKYCKVCQDAGKPESVYRGHNTRETRDPKSKVTCPTLLSLNCRYCHENGHTVKYCPVLATNDKVKKSNEHKEKQMCFKEKVVPTHNKGKNVTQNNAFACLDCDSDSEAESDAEVEQEFPALTTNNNHNKETKMNYASALTKPAPIKVAPVYTINLSNNTVVEEKPVLKQSTGPVIKVEPVFKVAPWATSESFAQKKWTAFDSDEEDEDDEHFEMSDAWD
jgi:hypothetical protein